MASVFSFLIATDCHLGYEENNQIIGNDSFVTFEEILIKAVDQNVDLILLGGDLFHHTNPSQKCMNKCIELLRRFTLGDKPVYFELLSNAKDVFCNTISETTNYLDDNINVSIPVFSIHGNHDDPGGVGHFSALDTLSSAGLINYFGKWTDLQDVTITPILLRKGKTKIALYGLSHIKDDRLCRLFLDKKVTFIRPEADPENWFNIFILHQNRVDRGPKRFVSESYIPEFIDLVIWGHEHDCEIEPLMHMEKGFYIIQPGSSVPTSLTEGEAQPKHVAVLKVFERKMKIVPLKLNTVRPFLWRSKKLWEIEKEHSDDRASKSEKIRVHCLKIVEEMIKEAEELRTGHPKQPSLPLIRLRCEYSDESELFNIVKFGQHFQGRVANPNGEIIRLKRCFTKSEDNKKLMDFEKLDELYKDNMDEKYNFTACITHIVKDYLTNHKDSKMLVLRVPEMEAAVERFLDKDDPLAIDYIVDYRFEKMLKELKEQKVNADETDLIALFNRMRDEDEKMDLKEEQDFLDKFKKSICKEKSAKTSTSGSSMARSFCENDVGNDVVEESSTDDDMLGGMSKDNNKFDTDSDTDEYNLGKTPSDYSFKSKRKNSSNDSSDDFFANERENQSRKAKAIEAKKTTRGRARGRGGRGRAKGNQSKPSPQKTKQAAKIMNSFLYDDDSD